MIDIDELRAELRRDARRGVGLIVVLFLAAGAAASG
jgi:hypothetical protein